MSHIPGTRIHFGKEKSVGDYWERAKWERGQARSLLRQHPGASGRIIAKMHLRTARAYERLMQKRMTHVRRSR